MYTMCIYIITYPANVQPKSTLRARNVQASGPKLTP